MDAWIGFAIALPSFAGGVGITIYFARMAIRHARYVERVGEAAALRTIADGIGEDTDPRRIAATLRFKADLVQRSADTLRPEGSTR
jgi:Flp pilus assembly protein TadG